MDIQALTTYFKTEIQRAGFFDHRIHGLVDLKDEKKAYQNWLDKSYHGKMKYLENNLDIRFQPELIMEGTKTIITVLLNYKPEKKLPFTNNYRIAKYAYGKDYHILIKQKLNQIAENAIKEFGPFSYRSFTDSAPIPDRHLAQKSGLGWIGKNTLLIHPQFGSFFFIGHLFLDILLDYDPVNHIKDLCLDCNKCINACPTNALEEPYLMNATKCISYQTIENKSALKDIPYEKFRGYIYGCDICQDVCPFNKSSAQHDIEEFHPHPKLWEMTKLYWEKLEPMEFGHIFKNSAVKRAGYKGLMQNIQWLSNNQSNTDDE